MNDDSLSDRGDATRTLHEMSDEQLVELWRKGHSAAGQVLYERYHSTVKRFFTRRVIEPEELVQHTFLSLTEAKGRFRGNSTFKVFLFGIALNVLRNHFKRVKRERAIEGFSSTAHAHRGPSPSQVVASRDESQALLDALRTLPVELQLVVELRYWDLLKLHEIASVLKMPQGTVNNHLRRARQRLGRVMN